ncbi:Retinoblastoma-binding protein 5 [Hypsizygus marmoreus]|uniref:Retinoblastoma-binding protein 5 n=1 Tax=Hypsizygus marmoreus TaxID=39966 RepID=A0A369JNV1_HYPMA|nr:Retinoblastoma-binding protein 5 [Hypsizygus marmoreus]
MNESLISPFNITHPTAVQTSLFASALFARFDPLGRYIGVGGSNGSAAIWDLETRARIRSLEGHVKAVTSLDWSKNSRWVLTSSKDWNVIIWDLASKCDPIQRHSTIRFDAPVLSASFHPRNSKIVLALISTGEVFVADLRKEHRSRVELCEPQDESDVDGQSGRMRSAMTVARFDPSGKHIFVGTSSGFILVFSSRNKTLVARHKISGAGSMKGLDFVKSGRRLVTNSSDRTLRQFNLPTYPPPNLDGTFIDDELEPTHRFNDPINKTAWYAMAYSPDGEWLAGGAADPATHKIYIWDISNDGQFASALDGGREPLVHLHWHPSKSSMASTTNHGNILIWHCPNPERWGAFAGGFEEVDENVEYEEKEDEFDIEDEEVILKRKMKAEEEEVDVDTIAEDSGRRSAQPDGMDVEDEDYIWADQETEDTADFRMRIIMQDDSDL